MKRCLVSKYFLAILLVMFFVQSAFAIGMWSHGMVSRAPWYADNYRYMVVDNIQYTIMKDAVAQEVIKKNDADYKSEIDIEDIRRGDEILIQAEGNRIYQIEILR